MNKLFVFASSTLVAAIVYPASSSWARDLVDLIPGLYGGDGITLAPPNQPDVPSHEAHFVIDAAAAINQLNDQIAPEIRPSPVTPSAGGLTYRFDPEQGTYMETSDTLGPIITERPQTLGQGKFSIGLAYTFFEYDEFEGRSLSSLRSSALHDPDILPPDDARTFFELDALDIEFDVDLKFRTLALGAAYGVTDQLDVGIVIPFVDAKLDVSSRASIIVDPESREGIHNFEGGPESPEDSASGSASGLGDIILGAKYYWIDEERYDISGGLQVKLETGDEDDFLGTGSTTVRPTVIGAYELTDSINLRSTLGFDFDLDDSDRNEFLYNVGVDAGNQEFAGVVDIIGREKLESVEVGESIIDAAFGFKWKPTENLIFSTNLVVPLNDDGLRSDLITTIGIEYRN